MWRLFQALVMIIVGWGVIYLGQEHGAPQNGYLTGILAIIVAYWATLALGKLIDLLRGRRAHRDPALSESGGDQGTLPGR